MQGGYVALALLGLALAAPSVKGQQPIKVGIGIKSGEDSNEVTAQVKAKIASTSGYALTDGAARLTVDITCLKASQNWYACASYVFYFPLFSTLDSDLQGKADTIVVGNASYCAAKIFEAFITGTQPEKLAAAKAKLDKDVVDYTQEMKKK